MHEYKHGDTARVIGLPEGLYWYSPRNQRDLANSDVITIEDGTPRHLTHKAHLRGGGCTEFTADTVIFLAIGHCPIGIPVAWLEPIVEQKVCTCDVWAGGCTCGAFREEQEGKSA